MKNEIENNPVEIYSGISWEAEMIKNNLENEGIEAFIQNEITGTLAPFYISPGSLGGVKIFVMSDNYVEAKKIVSEYLDGRKSDK